MKPSHENGPAGLDENDDYGLKSSWYVFSAPGICPVAGSTQHWVGSPVFDRAILRRERGDVEIISHVVDPGMFYVESQKMLGLSHELLHFSPKDLAGGERLEFQIGGAPSELMR